MKLILAIVALAILVQDISTADLDVIQNATPIGIPLNNPSIEFGGVNNGDTALEEQDLSGYRPLYPPYFQRNNNEQPQTYYDKEYYSRGSQGGNFEARLDRTLKTPAPGPAPAVFRPAVAAPGPAPPVFRPAVAASGPAPPAFRPAIAAPGPAPPALGPVSLPVGPEDDVQVYVVSLDSQSRPESVVQLQGHTQTQIQVPPQSQFQTAPQQTQFQPQARPQTQSRQYARGFSNYRSHQQTQSYYYSFKFPSS